METLDTEHMDVPSPSLYAFLLRVLSMQDPREDSAVSCMEQIIHGASLRQVSNVPIAIGNVLTLFRSSPDFLRFAFEIAAAFDLYEISHMLAEIAQDEDDVDLLVAAAGVCGNPGTPEEVRTAVASIAAGFPPALIRIDAAAPADTDALRRLKRRCWPGLFDADDYPAEAPNVVFDADFSTSCALRLTGPLLRKGYMVRRFAVSDTLPPWFGAQTIILGNAGNSYLSKQFPSSRYMVVDDNERDIESLNRTLQRVWEARETDWKPSELAPLIEPMITLSEGGWLIESPSMIELGFWSPIVEVGSIYPEIGAIDGKRPLKRPGRTPRSKLAVQADYETTLAPERQDKHDVADDPHFASSK